ncbi:hypothetical protein JVU11DRAFT_6488 [Chiua virens]|nr:hypothetical protein JVU11DRAFT_6488 [Chiua virens]
MDDSGGRCVDRQAKRVLVRSAHFETQIKDLDVRLSLFLSATRVNPTSFLQSKLREQLSNFRAIETSIRGALSELNVSSGPLLTVFFLQTALIRSCVFDVWQRNTQRADQALNSDIPKLRDELQDSLSILQDLSTTLPRIQSRVKNIRLAYDSGRAKVNSRLHEYLRTSDTFLQAEELVNSLLWLNTDFRERWRLIIFASSAPVSWRWKALMRTSFAVFLMISLWVAWVALGGAYRAHRQRLVWGERLMS